MNKETYRKKLLEYGCDIESQEGTYKSFVETGYPPRFFEIVPHMLVYMAQKFAWSPYVMMQNYPNFSSHVVNTDPFGLRYTIDATGQPFGLGECANEDCSALVGCSQLYGIGLTSDQATVPSQLSKLTGNRWLNFGGRAHNLKMAYIYFSNIRLRFRNLDKIVIVGGANDLMFYLLSRRLHPIFGGMVGLSENIRKNYNSTPEFFVENDLPQTAQNYPALKASIAHDLANWKTLADSMDSSLTFIFQPFADTMERQLSPTEIELFSIMEEVGDVAYTGPALSAFMTFVKQFSNDVEELCGQLAIPFHNALKRAWHKNLDDQWMFHDHIHLTDNGSKAFAGTLAELIE